MTTLQLQRDRLASPTGTLHLLFDHEHQLRALDWDEPRMHRLLARHYRQPIALTAAKAPSALRHAIEAYFAGNLRALDGLSTCTGGTVFQRQVWAALREIAVGATTSYGALAVSIGRPKAVRAVGLANGQNPIGIVVPCHRVIGGSGALTGYAGGIERKRWLLQHEGVLA